MAELAQRAMELSSQDAVGWGIWAEGVGLCVEQFAVRRKEVLCEALA